MHVLTLLAWSLFAGPSAPASDDEGCALSADALQAPVLETLPKGTVLVGTKTADRHVTQTLRAANGVTTVVSMGGCAHLGFTVTVRPKKMPALKAATALMLETLRTLPLIAFAKTLSTQLMTALGAAKVVKSPAELACGDASCTFEVKPTEMVISYDFAL